MPGYSKQSGTWSKVAPYGKINGSWAKAKEAYANVNGTWSQWWLDSGVNDRTFTTFDTQNGFDQNIRSASIQSDGKIVLAGQLTTFNGVLVNCIIRLNSDGTQDTAFTANTGTGANSYSLATAIQSDGKILLGGTFTTFNGATVNRIVRLNSDGTRDTAFTTNTGTGANSNVSGIGLQSDGKIILTGDFTTFNGTTVNRIVRLNSDGTRDTTFTTNTGTGINNTPYTLTIQSDDKILVGGNFTTFNGATVNRIVRLNSNGTQDTAFTTNTSAGTNDIIQQLAIQSDGKIILVGSFTTFNGVLVNRIARLNSDGTRDTAFTTNTGSGANGVVYSVTVQSDGKIILGGDFTTLNGATVNRIVRLNSDGTRDTAFTTNTGTGANGVSYALVVQSNNKIIVAGNYSVFNGVTANRLVRLNSDGTRETSFINNLFAFNNTVYAIVVQTDGKILIGGQFTNFNGTPINYLVRLNSDGTRDTAFTTNNGTGPNGIVYSLFVQSDGKILVGGDFTTFNGTTVNRIVRLNSDGTRDTTFTTNTGTAFNSTIWAIAVQTDGKILIGGQFTNFNGTAINRIARLNSDGTQDTAFSTNVATGSNGAASGIVYAISVQSDGKIVLAGAFTAFNLTTVNRIVRLNSDGTRDTAFTTNTGSGANNVIYALVIQSDGKIILGGQFTTFNGATANTIVRLNSDGTRDTAFTTNIGTGVNGWPYALCIQSNSKIVVGGDFTTFNGATVNRIVRLNSNGTQDTAFTTNTGSGANAAIRSLVIQSDNKIVVGGVFFSFNGINRTYLARIGAE